MTATRDGKPIGSDETEITILECLKSLLKQGRQPVQGDSSQESVGIDLELLHNTSQEDSVPPNASVV
jgi:hypothetical protein